MRFEVYVQYTNKHTSFMHHLYTLDLDVHIILINALGSHFIPIGKKIKVFTFHALYICMYVSI